MLKKILFNIFSVANCDYDKKIYDENIGRTLTFDEFIRIFPNYKPIRVIRNEKIESQISIKSEYYFFDESKFVG